MSVNKVILIGRCGKDPEIRYMQNGNAVANVSLATSTTSRDKNTGEKIEHTEWHRITLYERLAEIAGEYVKKGSQIYVEGRLKYGKYTDKDGIERNTTDIVATSLTLLGGRDSGNDSQAPRQQPPQRQAPTGSTGSGFDDMDDDIPFISNAFQHDMTNRLEKRMRKYGF